MKRIAMLAGKGYVPLIWLQEAKKKGFTVVVIGIGETKEYELLREMADKFIVLPSVSWQLLITTLKEEGIKAVAALGYFDKKAILKGALKDWQLMRILGKAGKKTDLVLINSIIEALAKEGIRFIRQDEIMADLLPQVGILAGTPPFEKELQGDLTLAWRQAKAISRLGIGQVVAVKEGFTVAVEALEGTDNVLRRAFALAGNGLVVAKVAWPGPLMDIYEMPTIGEKTFEILLEIKARALIVEAEKVMILGGGVSYRRAHEAGLIVIARKEKP